MHKFSADLPFPPSQNNLFSQRRDGRRFIADHYARWRKQADLALMIARRAAPLGHGAAEVFIELRAPDRRKRDADNGQKAILDSLVRMNVIEDDSNKIVRRIETRWSEGEPGATVVVTWGH